MTSNETLNSHRTGSNRSKVSSRLDSIAKLLRVLSELNERSESSASLDSYSNLVLGTSNHHVDRFVLI